MAGAAAVGVYAWWASGLAPFTVWSYVAIAVPVAGLAAAALILPRRTRSTTPGSKRRPRGAAVPWIFLAAVAVCLECAALALGGRSSTVPTLSTVVDHALTRHGVRFVLFLVWLAVGWAPVLRPVVPWRRPEI
jgi:hypothetical protein